MCASPAIGLTYLTPADEPSVATIAFITADGSLVAMLGLTISVETGGALADGMDGLAAQAASTVDTNAVRTAIRRTVLAVRMLERFMGNKCADPKRLRNGTENPSTRLSAKRRTARRRFAE